MLALFPRRASFAAFLFFVTLLAVPGLAAAQCTGPNYVQDISQPLSPCPSIGGQCSACATPTVTGVPSTCWPLDKAPTPLLCNGSDIVCEGDGCLSSVTYSACCEGERTNLPQVPPSCPTRLVLPRFDSSLGELKKIEYWSRIQITEAVVTATNDSTTQSCPLVAGNYILTGNVFDPLQPIPPDCETSLLTGMFPGSGVAFVSAYSPTATGPLAPGESRQINLIVPGGFDPVQSSMLICREANTPEFQGASAVCDVEFAPRFDASNSVNTNCPNVSVAIRTRARVEVFVTYWFCRTPPIANCDRLDTCEGTAGIVNVLANDTHGDMTPITASTIDCGSLMIVAQGTRGVASVVPCAPGSLPCVANCIRYVPNPGQPPAEMPVRDTFYYTFVDAYGCRSNPGAVEVFLHPNPTVPDRTVSTCQGVPVDIELLCGSTTALGATFPGTCLTPPTVVIPPAVLDCTTLTILNPPNPTTQGSVSFVACTENCPNGMSVPCPARCLRFIPVPTFFGPITLDFTIADQFSCLDQGRVTINVNRNPVANPDCGEVCEGLNSSTVVNVLANDTLGGGTPLTMANVMCGSLEVIQQGTRGVATVAACDGSSPGCASCPLAACNGGTAPCANSCLRYALNAGQPPSLTPVRDTIRYRFRDVNGCYSNEGCVEIVVHPSPIPPSPTVTTCAGEPVDINITCGTQLALPATFPATCVGTIQVAAATIDCMSIDLIQPQPNPATQGTVAFVSCTDGCPGGARCPTRCLRFAPVAGFTGQVAIGYQLRDNYGCQGAGVATVTVYPNPIANPDCGEVCEGRGESVVVNVLANDRLGDGSVLTSANIQCGSLEVIQQGTRGVASVAACVAGSPGCVACPPAACGAGTTPCVLSCIRYVLGPGQPPANVPVRDTIRYRFRDANGCWSNEGCLEIVVHPLPVLVEPRPQTCQGVPVAFDVLCGTTLASGTTFTGTCLGSIVVPAATLDCASLALVDPVPNPLTQGVAVIAPCVGGCAGGGTLPCARACVLFTPVAGFTGEVAIGFRVADNYRCSEAGIAYVTVKPPPITGRDTACTCQTSDVLIDVLANDTAAPGRSLDRCSLAVASAPTYGSVHLDGSPQRPCADRRLRYTPPAVFVGTDRSFVDTFTYSIADDNGCVSTGTVAVTVYLTPIANDDAAAVDYSTPDLPPITIQLFDNDVPNPLPPSVLAAITVPPDGTKGTLVSFDPSTGVAVYDPLPTFTGEDTFQYRLCNPTPPDCDGLCAATTPPTCVGCCSEATVTVRLVPPCPTLNRRQPGSLLIFPIIDNRQNNLTLVTVTNTNCDMRPVGQTLLAGTVDVKFVYVGKYDQAGNDIGCATLDRTRRLSPCDTVTIYTTADNPSHSLGYLYVYALSPKTGEAIVFNYLIGQELFVDGLDGREDAVNAIIYRGIGSPSGGDPRPTGTATDLDGDGHRDLDAKEYDPSPDRILIPRFLGQELAGSAFRSRLILLALTGGTDFTTNLDLWIYNDNEVVQSANLEFRCWDWRFLTDISGGFANGFLKALGDDPNEILGAPDRESGWIRIDGNVAFSTQVQIQDPSFWAVLIEAVPPHPVIDLPWEECGPRASVQDNGVLLPNGPFGDL